MTPQIFVDDIKKRNKKIHGILWNNHHVTHKQRKENYERICNIVNINDGYDCSSFEPLLFLIAKLYNVSIIHYLCNNKIEYINKCYKTTIITFHSNKSHFW